MGPEWPLALRLGPLVGARSEHSRFDNEPVFEGLPKHIVKRNLLPVPTGKMDKLVCPSCSRPLTASYRWRLPVQHCFGPSAIIDSGNATGKTPFSSSLDSHPAFYIIFNSQLLHLVSRSLHKVNPLLFVAGWSGAAMDAENVAKHASPFGMQFSLH